MTIARLALAVMLCMPTVVAAMPLRELRDRCAEAVKDSDGADSFYDDTRTLTEEGPSITLGYRGMASMLKASHSFFPLRKLRFFREGEQDIERAIERSPDDVELRYLRVSIQQHVPFFLDYHGKIDEDEAILRRYLETPPSGDPVDEDLRERVKRYFAAEHRPPMEEQ